MRRQEIIGRAQEAFSFLKLAVLCLYEQIIGRELSCPPCWVCTSLRIGIAVVFASALYAVFGALALLFLVIPTLAALYNRMPP